MSTRRPFDRGHTDDLMSFLAASPSPYHAVANAAERLRQAGFHEVAETDAWEGGSGGRYVLRGGAIIAWYVPENAAPHTPFRIIGAHTDSPNLRVKPRPDSGAHGWRQIAVEIYGGPLMNSWLDRDLGLAGVLDVHLGLRLGDGHVSLARFLDLHVRLGCGDRDLGGIGRRNLDLSLGGLHVDLSLGVLDHDPRLGLDEADDRLGRGDAHLRLGLADGHDRVG